MKLPRAQPVAKGPRFRSSRVPGQAAGGVAQGALLVVSAGLALLVLLIPVFAPGLAAALGLSAVPSKPGASQPVSVRYMLWDSAQLPAYRQCADAFMQKNPDVRVRIQQVGWGDYWTSLSTGFIAGSAPDVFVNHLVHAPQYMRYAVLEDLRPWAMEDRLDLQDQPPALLKAWHKEGRLLGLPKDWDTVALVVNLDHAQRVGVDPMEFRSLSWNPRDGGSFEQLIRRLTVDHQGRNALHPQFDSKHVAVHGFQPSGPGGMSGQTEWSWLAAANGHVLQSEPWAAIRYSDPRLGEAIQWLAGLANRGLAAPASAVRSLGPGALFASGRVAMVADGSWMATYYARTAPFPSTWFRLPMGPSGQGPSMLNGTADSMWVGSKVKPQAWRWMAFLASAECQQLVARSGIVFPARLPLADLALQAHRAKGIDSTAFVAAAREPTFLMPIVEDAARIDDIVKAELEAVHLGRKTAEVALRTIDERVGALRR